MSLSKIGKFTDAFKIMSNVSSKKGFDNLVSTLKSTGDITAATSLFSRYGKNVNSGLAYNALIKAFPNENITDEIKSRIGYTGSGASGTVGSAALSTGLFASFKNVGSGIAAVFKSIAPMMIPLIIGAAGIKAGKMLWDNVLTDNAAQKNLQESVQKYKTEKSDLDNLQSQKETNKQRVYELRAKSNRTAAEDNELNNLLN